MEEAIERLQHRDKVVQHVDDNITKIMKHLKLDDAGDKKWNHAQTVNFIEALSIKYVWDGHNWCHRGSGTPVSVREIEDMVQEIDAS